MTFYRIVIKSKTFPSKNFYFPQQNILRSLQGINSLCPEFAEINIAIQEMQTRIHFSGKGNGVFLEFRKSFNHVETVEGGGGDRKIVS